MSLIPKYNRSVNNSEILLSSADLTASHMGASVHGLRTKIQNAKSEKKELEKRVERLDAHISFWEEQIKASEKPPSRGGRSYRKKRTTRSKRKTYRK
jgi:predicted nuclease with TOPRIM domain